jgi:hypothetical protein
MRARPASNIKCICIDPLIQVASKVQDTGGGSYLIRSYSISQAQEVGPAGLQLCIVCYCTINGAQVPPGTVSSKL